MIQRFKLCKLCKLCSKSHGRFLIVFVDFFWFDIALSSRDFTKKQKLYRNRCKAELWLLLSGQEWLFTIKRFYPEKPFN